MVIFFSLTLKSCMFKDESLSFFIIIIAAILPISSLDFTSKTFPATPSWGCIVSMYGLLVGVIVIHCCHHGKRSGKRFWCLFTLGEVYLYITLHHFTTEKRNNIVYFLDIYRRIDNSSKITEIILIMWFVCKACSVYEVFSPLQYWHDSKETSCLKRCSV